MISLVKWNKQPWKIISKGDSSHMILGSFSAIGIIEWIKEMTQTIKCNIAIYKDIWSSYGVVPH